MIWSASGRLDGTPVARRPRILAPPTRGTIASSGRGRPRSPLRATTAGSPKETRRLRDPVGSRRTMKKNSARAANGASRATARERTSVTTIGSHPSPAARTTIGAGQGETGARDPGGIPPSRSPGSWERRRGRSSRRARACPTSPRGRSRGCSPGPYPWPPCARSRTCSGASSSSWCSRGSSPGLSSSAGCCCSRSPSLRARRRADTAGGIRGTGARGAPRSGRAGATSTSLGTCDGGSDDGDARGTFSAPRP
mmetsp:Transcript_15199/g.59419  ORF Transcript_15199/g.59419 Transcript_15199/m.59419 type:complete len:253 (-) Transcript_15199:331-1089(-)